MGGTPVRRGILALDIEGFGQQSRTDPQRAQLRARHPIDQAYVSLAVARSMRGADSGDEEELTGAGIDVLSAFEPHKRVVVCGGAGSGKRTLLEWLAVRAPPGTRRRGPADGVRSSPTCCACASSPTPSFPRWRRCRIRSPASSPARSRTSG